MGTVTWQILQRLGCTNPPTPAAKAVSNIVFRLTGPLDHWTRRTSPSHRHSRCYNKLRGLEALDASSHRCCTNTDVGWDTYNYICIYIYIYDIYIYIQCNSIEIHKFISSYLDDFRCAFTLKSILNAYQHVAHTTHVYIQIYVNQTYMYEQHIYIWIYLHLCIYCIHI